MSEFTGGFGEALDDECYDEGANGALRGKLRSKFNEKLKHAKRSLYVVLALCVLFGAYSAWQLSRATSTKSMFMYAILILIMYEGTILIKLWYWVVNAKYVVLKELKELELQVAQLAETCKRRED
ncbi:MAG: DUF6768 family protein [Planctomycetota bacterium]|jgi:hypothetical protein